jgi:hypothetical protein
MARVKKVGVKAARRARIVRKLCELRKRVVLIDLGQSYKKRESAVASFAILERQKKAGTKLAAKSLVEMFLQLCFHSDIPET